jgi:type IV secretory pathway TrbF-like protein
MATEKQKKVQVKRPVNQSAPVQPDKWDGKFKSVEPLKNQKPSRERKKRYKWNHPATINWIMGQADPVGFLSGVMQGREMFSVYTQDEQGNVQDIGKVGADPELRIMAAKTLLSKCMPDLKAVEVTAQIEEKKVLDISKLTGEDLNAIERVLEHAVIDGSQSGEDAEIVEGVYQEQLASD